MSIIRPNRIGRRWLGLPISTPRALFNNGENGLFLDFSDIRSLYTDASGTTPVAAPGDTIRLAADKSRARSPITAYAGVQANTGLAPRFGRAPKSRRQLWRLDSGMSTGWVSAGTTPPTVTNGATQFGQPCVAVAYDQTMTAGYAGSRANSLAGAPIVAGRTYVGSVDICLSRALVGPEVIAVVVTGSNGFPGTTLNAANSAAYVGQWLRAALPSGTPGLSGSNGVYTHLSGSLASPVTLYLKNFQWEEGTTPTAYQATTTVFDMTEAGFPSFGYARFDLVDDVLSTVLTLAQTGDVLLFGRNGSWIEPGRVFGAGATLAIGPTGTAITPLILRSLGDLVGIVAIGRTLNAEERLRVMAYFGNVGAAGFLVGGAEQVANGNNEAAVAVAPNDGLNGFASKTQSADQAQSGTYSAKLTANAASNTHYWLLISVPANEAVQVSGWVYIPSGATNGQSVRLVDIADGSYLPVIADVFDQWVPFSATRGAKATGWTLALGNNTPANWAGGAIYVDNLSVKTLRAGA